MPNLVRTIRIPRYQRVYLQLRDRIQNGDYFDALFPGERRLAQEFHVARVTIRAALACLAKDGLISKKERQGTIPRRSRTKKIEESTILDGGFPTLHRKTSIRVLGIRMILPPPEIQSALRITAGEQVQKAIRVRVLGETPIAHVTSYLPSSFAQYFTKEAMTRHPMYVIFRDVGRQITSVQQTISARLADGAVAETLKIVPGSPLLCVTRIAYDVHEIPLQVLSAVFIPDFYRYRMTLSLTEGDRVHIDVGNLASSHHPEDLFGLQ